MQVIISDGCSYEREAITTWLQRNLISPLTGRKLPNSQVIPNIRLRGLIEEFRNEHEVDLRARSAASSRRQTPRCTDAQRRAIQDVNIDEEAMLRIAIDFQHSV